MTRPEKAQKALRTRYSDDYKSEALKLAERVGVKAVAKQLGLHESQLYGWRGKARQQLDRGELEQQQATELVRLKRQLAEREEELAILKKAAAYFASHQR